MITNHGTFGKLIDVDYTQDDYGFVTIYRSFLKLPGQ